MKQSLKMGLLVRTMIEPQVAAVGAVTSLSVDCATLYEAMILLTIGALGDPTSTITGTVKYQDAAGAWQTLTDNNGNAVTFAVQVPLVNKTYRIPIDARALPKDTPTIRLELTVAEDTVAMSAVLVANCRRLAEGNAAEVAANDPLAEFSTLNTLITP